MKIDGKRKRKDGANQQNHTSTDNITPERTVLFQLRSEILDRSKQAGILWYWVQSGSGPLLYAEKLSLGLGNP